MGAFNLPDWFVPKYQDEISVRAQQMTPRVADRTQNDGSFKGDDCYFPRIGSMETIRATRLGTLALANVAVDWVKVSATPEFAPIAIWDPDKNKLNLDVAGSFAAATVRAMNRAKDRQVIDALNDAATNGVANTKGDAAETITTIGDYNTIADLEMIANAIVKLGTNEMFEGEDITIVTPFRVQVQNALDPYLAKSDVKANRPWDNLTWRQYEKLPGNGTDGTGLIAPNGDATGVDIYVFARSAVHSGANDVDVPIDERLGAQLASMMGYWFQACSKVIEPKGVIRIQSKADFSLARHAIPTKAV